MNVQPKLPTDDECVTMERPRGAHPAPAARRVPGGPRAFSTRDEQTVSWPIELEVDPWRP